MKEKLIVILGPTASGKTDLSIKLARKFSGEIISADSRQIYKGMDIGTGKITPDTKNSLNFSAGQEKKKYFFTHKGIPHYCIDIVSPKIKFNVAQYQKLALRAINKIQKREKIPFLVGGTGFYIQSIVDGILIPKVKPDWKLRKKLEKNSVAELFKILKKLDPKRAEIIDKNNPRRLIRAIEIAKKLKGPVPSLSLNPKFDVLEIGIKKSPEELKKLIEKRLLKRLAPASNTTHSVAGGPARHNARSALGGGMINEVENLHKSGVSFKRLEEFGLEYRYIALYLQGKMGYEEMTTKLQKEIEHFAKRQMTWFKRDKRIYWVKNYKKAEKLVKDFLD